MEEERGNGEDILSQAKEERSDICQTLAARCEEGKEEETESDFDGFADLFSQKRCEIHQDDNEDTDKQKKLEQQVLDLEFAEIHSLAKEEFETDAVANIYDKETLSKILIEERKSNKKLTDKVFSAIATGKDERKEVKNLKKLLIQERERNKKLTKLLAAPKIRNDEQQVKTENQKKREQPEIDVPECADMHSSAKEEFETDEVENIDVHDIKTLRKLLIEKWKGNNLLTSKCLAALKTRNDEKQTEEQMKWEQPDLPVCADIHSAAKSETDAVENINSEEGTKREQPEIDHPEYVDIHSPAKVDFEAADEVKNIHDIYTLRKQLIEELKWNKGLTAKLISTLETGNQEKQKKLDTLQKDNYKMTQDIERYEYISKFLQKAKIVLEVQNELPALPTDHRECFKQMIGTTPTEEGDSPNQSNSKSAHVSLMRGRELLFEKSVPIKKLQKKQKEPEYKERITLSLIELDPKDKNHLHCEEYLLTNKKLLAKIKEQPNTEDLELFLFTKLSPCTDRQPRSPKQAKNCHTIISEKSEILNVKIYVCFDVYYADGFDLLQTKYDDYLSPVLRRSGKKIGLDDARLFWTDEGLERVQSVLALEFLPIVSTEAFFQIVSSLKLESEPSELEKNWILESWKQAVVEHRVNEKACINVFPAFEANLAKLSECCKLFSEQALMSIDHFMNTMGVTEENKTTELPQNLREKINKKLLEKQNNVSQESMLTREFSKLLNENVLNCFNVNEPLSIDTLFKLLTDRYTVRLNAPTIGRKVVDELIPLIRKKINETANERLSLHMINYTVRNTDRIPTKQLTFYKYS